MVEHIPEKIRRARLRVNPPIAESELLDFESHAGISIPDDYREFLLRCSNGGQAPCRLVPLSRWNHCYWSAAPLSRASADCVVTPDAVHHVEKWIDATGVKDWESKWDADEWDPMNGTIAVAEIGCGLFFSMIMTGKYRGRIFSWGDHALNPPYFVEQPNFLTWIDSCLDTTISGKPVHFLDGRIS